MADLRKVKLGHRQCRNVRTCFCHTVLLFKEVKRVRRPGRIVMPNGVAGNGLVTSRSGKVFGVSWLNSL